MTISLYLVSTKEKITQLIQLDEGQNGRSQSYLRLFLQQKHE